MNYFKLQRYDETERGTERELRERERERAKRRGREPRETELRERRLIEI